MFANLAHGGAFVAGEPWDPKGVNTALGEDFGSSKNLVDQNGNAQPGVSGSCPFLECNQCPSYLTSDSNGNNLCSGQVLFHGNHTLMETSTGAGTNDGAVGNLGVPLFNSWPLWTSTVHQQVYYKWLERAWLGGLRLMVMDAVSNEALCKNFARVSGEDCSLSMNDIDNQLLAAQSFQTWLDTQYGGPGKGWFQIVTTPQQATSVIQQGKLAVVLGIEVDNIFNCHKQNPDGTPVNGEGPQTCDVTYVKQQLQKYYAMGVRHIFPIHDFDNAFGTTATWQDAINAGQRAGEGAWQDAVNCTDPGYGFSFNATAESLILLVAFGINDVPAYPAFTSGSCSNGTGITPLGTNMIQQAMNMGFIIDVDHMSINGFFNTLQQATSQYPAPYAGIVASHVQFFDLYEQNYPGTGNYGRHERMRTYSQLQRIAQVGGMIGVMLKDDAQDTGNGWCLPQGKCFPFISGKIGNLGETGPDFTKNYDGPNHPNNNSYRLNQNCLYSTTETAQQYLYGVKAMNGVGVALGSDFMGIAGHVGPRFGNGACGGHADQRGQQERAQLQSTLWNLPGGRLTYPFTLPGFGTFDKQVSGQKTYDFNVDGLAHIGLLPDMVADLMNVGVDVQQLQPLFGSAQAYINMWSKVYKNAPVTTASITTGTGAASPFSSAGLAQGQEMDSPNGIFRAIMQTDGNFVIYQQGSAIWATGTQGQGRPPYRLAVQPDGNLVIYGSSANDVSLGGYGVCSANWACIATWAIGTRGGSAPYTLKMQDDGNLVLYDSTSSAVWASGTQR
ncbi:MAG TPA: membrane dipeptidase [Bryobacteraceae bacterium]|nr:membrane dipeptidase [Bryobacteraceae bacterium]